MTTNPDRVEFHTEPPGPVPDVARTLRPSAHVLTMGAPRRPDGTEVPDVGAAQMLVQEHADAELGHMFTAYYQLTEAQLAALNAGGVIEIAQWGAGVQPFSLAVIVAGE